MSGRDLFEIMFGSFRVAKTGTLRRLFAGAFISAFGTGMTLSLLLVYLHDIRGFSNAFGGFLLSYMAVVAIVLTGPSGWLIDRIGPKPVIIFGLFVEGSAVAAWSIVESREHAILVGTLSAIGTLMIWPAQTVMITRSTDEEDRQGAFAVNFMMLNLGIAFGGLIAASIIQEGNLRSFQTLYLVDSLSYFGYLIMVLTIKDKFQASEAESKKTGAGYREVLKDKTFMRIILGGLGYITFGYASLQAGLAIFTTQYLDLSPKWLGLVFAANTISIFFLQGFMLRWLESVVDLVALRRVGYLWGFSWIIIGSASLASGVTAGVLVSLSQVAFAFGEMIWAPKAPSIVNRIAPEELRGRYNSVMAMNWNIAAIIGAALVGLMIGRGLYLEWLILMLIGSVLPITMFRSIPGLEVKERANS